MYYSIPNIVATIAGAAATAKTLYDWVQSRSSERPVITGTPRYSDFDCHLLYIKVVRLPRHDVHVWRIQGSGLVFFRGRHTDGARWAPGDFEKSPELDWTVTSEAGTAASELTRSQTYDTYPIFTKVAQPKSGVYSVRLLVSKFTNISRKRWVGFQVKGFGSE